MKNIRLSIAAEDIAGVDFGGDVIKAGIVAVGYYSLTLGFELIEIIYDQ